MEAISAARGALLGMTRKKKAPKQYTPKSIKPIPIPKAPTDWQCMWGCGETFWDPNGASKHEKNCKKNPKNQ